MANPYGIAPQQQGAAVGQPQPQGPMTDEEKIAAMVNAGQISPEEGNALLQQVQEQMQPRGQAAEMEGGGAEGNPYALDPNTQQAQAPKSKDEYVNELAYKLQEAVNNGEMTPEQADQYFQEGYGRIESALQQQASAANGTSIYGMQPSTQPQQTGTVDQAGIEVEQPKADPKITDIGRDILKQVTGNK